MISNIVSTTIKTTKSSNPRKKFLNKLKLVHLNINKSTKDKSQSCIRKPELKLIQLYLEKQFVRTVDIKFAHCEKKFPVAMKLLIVI